MKVIVDSSAIISVVFNEHDGRDILRAITKSQCAISAANYLEAAIVIDSTNDPVVIRKFDKFMKDSDIEVLSVDPKQAVVARAAYRDYGKGSGHRAKLNFGDVFAYALASTTRRKLLCKGEDFRHTDIAILGLLSD